MTNTPIALAVLSERDVPFVADYHAGLLKQLALYVVLFVIAMIAVIFLARYSYAESLGLVGPRFIFLSLETIERQIVTIGGLIFICTLAVTVLLIWRTEKAAIAAGIIRAMRDNEPKCAPPVSVALLQQQLEGSRHSELRDAALRELASVSRDLREGRRPEIALARVLPTIDAEALAKAGGADPIVLDAIAGRLNLRVAQFAEDTRTTLRSGACLAILLATCYALLSTYIVPFSGFLIGRPH